MVVQKWDKIKWDLEDIPGFTALINKIGSDNVSMVVDLTGEGPMLWVYGPGESKELGGGNPFNFAKTCPPRPPEECEN